MRYDRAEAPPPGLPSVVNEDSDRAADEHDTATDHHGRAC